MWYRRAACPAPQVNRAFLERCNEVETTFETSGSESAPASAASVRATSTAAEGETSPGSADVRNAETKAARKRAAELESERQQGVVYYEAYRTLGRLQTFVWINTKGFQKIMKKYDKRQQLRGTGNELGPDFEKRLEKEAFCSGKLEALPLPWLCLLWLYTYYGYTYHGSTYHGSTHYTQVLVELFKQRRPKAASSSAMGGGGGRLPMQLLAGNGNPELAELPLTLPLTPILTPTLTLTPSRNPNPNPNPNPSQATLSSPRRSQLGSACPSRPPPSRALPTARCASPHISSHLLAPPRTSSHLLASPRISQSGALRAVARPQPPLLTSNPPTHHTTTTTSTSIHPLPPLAPLPGEHPDPRERSQLRRVHHTADLPARQRQPDGAPPLRLRTAPRLGRPRHRRRAVLRVRHST